MDDWTSMTEAWRNYMTVGGATRETVAQRVYHLDRLAKGVGGTPADLTLERLVEWLAGQNWKPNTLRTARASYRAFYHWATETGRLAESPAHKLPPVRVPRARPRPTPEDAFRLALLAADDRERLAILLAGTAGLRRGEVARARREDLERDLDGFALRVVGKGGHVRLVPLTDDLGRLVWSKPAGWLFPSPKGDHLTPAHLGKIVSSCFARGLATHNLRHRAGTRSYAATHDLRAVQEFLGHAKPETTAIYTEVPSSAIRAAMEGAA